MLVLLSQSLAYGFGSIHDKSSLLGFM